MAVLSDESDGYCHLGTGVWPGRACLQRDLGCLGAWGAAATVAVGHSTWQEAPVDPSSGILSGLPAYNAPLWVFSVVLLPSQSVKLSAGQCLPMVVSAGSTGRDSWQRYSQRVDGFYAKRSCSCFDQNCQSRQRSEVLPFIDNNRLLSLSFSNSLHTRKLHTRQCRLAHLVGSPPMPIPMRMHPRSGHCCDVSAADGNGHPSLTTHPINDAENQTITRTR